MTTKQTPQRPSSKGSELPIPSLKENDNNEYKRGETRSSADHRALGEQLDLFSINEETGIGLVLWHPKGDLVRRIIKDYWEAEHLKREYQLVCTPHTSPQWSSGKHLDHMDYYAEAMGLKISGWPMVY